MSAARADVLYDKQQSALAKHAQSADAAAKLEADWAAEAERYVASVAAKQQRQQQQQVADAAAAEVAKQQKALEAEHAAGAQTGQLRQVAADAEEAARVAQAAYAAAVAAAEQASRDLQRQKQSAEAALAASALAATRAERNLQHRQQRKQQRQQEEELTAASQQAVEVLETSGLAPATVPEPPEATSTWHRASAASHTAHTEALAKLHNASVDKGRDCCHEEDRPCCAVPSTPAGVEGKCYSCRAAANLLSRLRNSQARMAALNSNLRNQLLNLDEAGRTALITSLCKCNGDLDALNVSFETETINEEFSRNTSTLEQEVINKYGSAKAEEVMSQTLLAPPCSCWPKTRCLVLIFLVRASCALLFHMNMFQSNMVPV